MQHFSNPVIATNEKIIIIAVLYFEEENIWHASQLSVIIWTNSKWQPTWIYDRHDFSYFLSTSHPDASYQVSSQLAFQFRRRGEK